MYKTLAPVFALGLAACGVSPAGPYERADNNRKSCESAGEIAELAYQAKVRGKPSLEWLLAVTVKQTADIPYPFPDMAQGTVRRGYAASSRSDAKMAGWSFCMDTLRR